ncbi:MAG TPA: helix-turn-helix domain-containing protein [Aldersonia sp.]
MAQRNTPTRRPRDRRQQIIASASLQFRGAGYHNVGITEIAEAVGITSGALYRHFSGKQDLLFAAVEDTVERLRTVWAHPDHSLEELLDATCALVTHGPHLGVLWAREITHLSADQQRELRARVLAAIEPLRSALARERQDLSPDAVDLLLWAAVGVIGSAGFYAMKLDADKQQARLLEGCLAVCRNVTVAAVDAAQELDSTLPLPGALLPASRQEAILAAATRLFSTRGYQAVGVDDIGAVAGITGATVYHHYPNKSAILRAALLRGLQAMLFDLSGALESSTTPADALAKLVHFYTRTSVEHGQVIAALRNEAINLPAEERRSLMHAQVDYLAEWVALLGRYRAELSEPEARVLVEATTSTISSILAIPHLRRRPTLRAELESIGRAILGLPDESAGMR